jgi:hypothetical protein
MKKQIQDNGTNSQTAYYPVSLAKFITMNLCTSGLYLVYWFYKSWSYIQKRDDRNVFWAFTMAILGAIFFYPLMQDMNSHFTTKNSNRISSPLLLAVVFFMLNITWKLPDPYWLLSIFSFLLVVPVVVKINIANHESTQKAENSRFSKKNILIIILGSAITIFSFLSTFNILPSTHVITGEKLSNSNLQFLRQKGLINDNETIIHFYSGSIFSIKNDGNFYTNQSVVSYESLSDKLYSDYAFYSEIEDIKVEYSTSYLEDTEITITKKDGASFILLVSNEEHLDKVFVKGLMILLQKDS